MGHVSWLRSFLPFFLPQSDVFVPLMLLAKIGNRVRSGEGFYMKTELTFSIQLETVGCGWWLVTSPANSNPDPSFSPSLSCGTKSLLYSFNFLKELIPLSVAAQAFNPCTLPLSRGTAAAPDPAGLE